MNNTTKANPFLKMNWDEYQKVFFNFWKSMNQTRIISLISRKVLVNYPQNIPENIIQKTNANFKVLAESLNEFLDDSVFEQSEPGEASRHEISLPFTEDELMYPMFTIYVSNLRLKEKITKIDFELLCKYQEVVMYYFHFDNFLCDSLKTICFQCPNSLKSAKNITWEEIIESGSYNNILTKIINKKVYDFGWDSILKRIESFNNEYNLNITVLDESLLKKIEIMRNIIAHGGGIVDDEYKIIFKED